ncbi:endonuclease III [Helicobacter bizzozeronii CIII-1]|uniref:Endonuclease III n=1 Tax=Helicobacter bizzozeronii (strain CIII-1) TaxID=1002804 RepID=F8KQE5_HELBC|nr:endonuclease III [Helicobacter bizzozeronii CIII-1]
MKAQIIKELLLAHFPEPSTELCYNNPYELLVAVILSAQCTDARVNATTPALFAAYPSIQALANAQFAEVLALIKSISYPNNKAKHLIKMAGQVMQDFNGQIPSTQQELMRLAGVGQKSANVVLSVVFGQNYLAVDTHVFRVTHRLGLSQAKSATQTEKDLSALFKQDLGALHHALILFGRYTCKAIKPQCGTLFFAPLLLEPIQF